MPTCYFCCISVWQVIHRYFLSTIPQSSLLNVSNVWWITWDSLNALCTLRWYDSFSFSHSTDFNAPMFQASASHRGFSAEIGKVLALKSIVPLENVLLIIWDFSSCIKSLFTPLLFLNTTGPLLFTVLYFTPEYNLGLDCWCIE